MQISVIIPVYNAENTLKRCVDSLLTQDYADAEVILINDGSTDKSGDICKAYQRADRRIVYRQKENGGVSSARNAGLEIARGDYVVFVDSDDYVSPHYFDALNEMIGANDPDWIQFSNVLLRDGKSASRQRKAVVLNGEKAVTTEVSNMICHKTMNCPWDKVYKKSIIDDLHLRFHENINIGEDWAFNIAYSCCTRSFCGSGQMLYYVCEDRTDSLSRKLRKDTQVQLTKAIAFVREHIEGSNLSEEGRKTLNEAVNFYELSMIYTRAKDLQRSNTSFKECYKEISYMCKVENEKKHDYPNTRFCRHVIAPVKLGLVSEILFVSKKLMR